MATHHGRPGGRLVEVLAAFVLIGVSVAILVGALWAGFVGLMWFAGYVSPVFLAGVMVIATNYLFTKIFRLALWVLSALWGPFLKYYKYQAHTLRPLDDEGTNT